MAITVTNNVTAKEIDEIARLLDETIELTPRTKASLESNAIAVAHDDGKLIGWLISEHLFNNVYEIGGAYVHPSYRRHGVFTRLTDKLIKNECVYLVASYHPYIIQHFLNKHGFCKSSLLQFTKLSHGKFITKRIRSSLRIANHLSKQSAIYIVRMAT